MEFFSLLSGLGAYTYPVKEKNHQIRGRITALEAVSYTFKTRLRSRRLRRLVRQRLAEFAKNCKVRLIKSSARTI